MRKSVLLFFLLPMSALVGSFFIAPVVAQAESNSGNIVVQTIPGQTFAQKITDRTKVSWPWYIVRGSGIIAAVSLVLLMLSGIGLVTGYTYHFFEPLTAWASHRALGIAFGISILLHMFGLLFDHFVPFSIWQLLVPWLADYKPVTIFGLQMGSLYVALGVLSFYGVVLVILTSLFWAEKRPYLWKWTHLLSYLVIIFIFFHALYLGTDLKDGFFRWVWIAFGVIIASSVLYRLWRVKTI